MNDSFDGPQVNGTDGPLDELRRDWDALGQGQDPLGDDLAATDAGTQDAVQWMRRAWAALETDDIPALPLSLARAHARRRAGNRRRRFLLPMGSALAIAAVAVLIVALRTSVPNSPMGGGDPEVATGLTTGLTTGGPASSGADDAGEALRIEPLDLEPLRAASRLTEFHPDEIIPRADGIELVIGNVRIVLLNEQN